MRLFKGVGPGTHHYPINLHSSGIAAHNQNAPVNLVFVVEHIAHGSLHSPFVSLTASFGVAAQYARVGTQRATPSSPGYVYQFDIPDPLPQNVYDAALFIAGELIDRSKSSTVFPYHHNGDRSFLLSVVDPASFGHLKRASPTLPQGNSSSTPVLLTPHLEALVNALRDAEFLAAGFVPNSWITARHDVS